MKRTDKLIHEEIHDPYYEGKKYPEPAVCSECQLVYENGRWLKKSRIPENPNWHTCPACRRIKDRCPGGCVYLSGRHFELHRSDILNLIENVTEQIRNEHPIRRIMWQKTTKAGIEIATTDGHMARRLGEAVFRSQKGEFDIKYADEDNLVRVYWSREK